jgi:hypothetical protein
MAPLHSLDGAMKNLLITALALAISMLSVSARAEDTAGSATAGKPVKTGPPPSDPKKLRSAGEFGDELLKLGKGIGKGAAKAGGSAAEQVRRDVKKGPPKPGTKPPEPVERDRAGSP